MYDSAKGLYFDGHERKDVLEYRAEMLKRFEDQYLPRMTSFDGPQMETTIPRPRQDLKELVLATHDESTFKSNDDKPKVWRDKRKNRIKKKGSGASVHASVFACQCHGAFHRKIIHPGKNRDGWWTCERLVQQLKGEASGDGGAIKAFEELHPNAQALFMLDNSENHHGGAPLALTVANVPLKDGGVNVPTMKDGWFVKDGVKMRQSMTYHTQDGNLLPKGVPCAVPPQPWDEPVTASAVLESLPAPAISQTPVQPVFVTRGVRAMLEERGLFREDMKVKEARAVLTSQPDIQQDPGRCKFINAMALNQGRVRVPEAKKDPCASAKWEFEKPDGKKAAQDAYTAAEAKPTVHRAAGVGVKKGLQRILEERGLWQSSLSAEEARELLKKQPDFAEQPEWLREVVLKSGHLIDYYPKYHCELNWIERFWSVVKDYCRRNCTYSFADLQTTVPRAMDQVPLHQIRRFARGAMRYMDAYRNKLTAEQAAWATKIYKRHRVIPKDLLQELETQAGGYPNRVLTQNSIADCN